MKQTLASAFSEFSTGLSHQDVPSSVRDAAYWHIVDTIGVCLAGANPNEESGKAARRLATKWQSSAGATVLGIGTAARPEAAALINGALAQALEMDDKHGYSLARPGSTVTPAVLAIAEERNLPLRDVITAVVVGYEVMIRLGFVAGERFLERGYHTSSLLGAFGAAAAVGRLVGARPNEIVDALGISGTFASGIQESTRTGSTSKILHGGWGAHSGIIAIDLSLAGITGPSSVFEGKFGFFQTHLTPVTGELNWTKPAEGLGSRWYLPETAFKPYPCCQLLHAFIEAAKYLLTEFARDGVPLKAIERISCQLAEPGLTLVTEPKERKKAPDQPHEARFSLPFAVATTLIDGDVGLESFRPDRLGDPEIRRLAALVDASIDPNSDYPLHCPAILEIVANGTTYRRHVPYHPGSPEAPLSQDDVLDKFARNTTWIYGDGARDLGASLTRVSDTESLCAMLRLLVEVKAKHPMRKVV
jgi:2-methylcitrate dehydratase PrpD